jgi:golgi apparatus protein 1
MKTTRLILLLAAAALGLAAFGALPRAARADCECEDEASRLCSNVEPGQGRIWTCLLDHQDQLGWECKRHLNRKNLPSAGRKEEKAPVVAEDFQKACKADRKKFCKYVGWEDVRVTKCLRIHEVEISDKCRAALEP